MTYSAKRAIAAVLALWQRDRAERLHEGFDPTKAAEWLESVLPEFFPGAMQSWRPPDHEPTQPKPWVDEITGQPARNPWADPPDVTSQQLLLKRDPQLAEHLKKTAKGISYKMLIEQRDAAEARKVLRDFTYNAETHNKNPFIVGTITEQMEFAKKRPCAVVDAYKYEARHACCDSVASHRERQTKFDALNEGKQARRWRAKKTFRSGRAARESLGRTGFAGAP